MTIKAKIREKLKQKGWGVNDENIREIVKNFLGRICELLPQGNSHISKELIMWQSLFIVVVFSLMSHL